MKRNYWIALAAVLALSSCANSTSGIAPEIAPENSIETMGEPSTERTSGTTHGETSATSPTGTSGTTRAETSASSTEGTSGATRAETSASSPTGTSGTTRSETSAASTSGSSTTTRSEAVLGDTVEMGESPAADDRLFTAPIADEGFADYDTVYNDALPPLAPSEKSEFAAADSIAGGDVYAGAESESSADYDYDYSYIYAEPPQPQARAGLLTGGEWRDSDHFDFWKNLIGQRSEWSKLSRSWRLCTVNRIAVQVTANRSPAENVTVKLFAGETPIWEAVTDNRGYAYLFQTLDEKSQSVPTHITAERGGKQLAYAEYREGESCSLTISEEIPRAKGLDLMFVIDTTGSMGDELAYLQAELEGVIGRITKEKQISTRLGLNFYRDEGDEYVVRGCDFSDDIRRMVTIMNEQKAAGGGDNPEAVERALSCAIYEQSWNEDSVKLLFLVLDAPPHYTEENVETIRVLLADAARKGIRIIPVASSGVDTETEFLCRSFSLATGGTYTFLTDHSGIGGSHLEPTIGSYQVEKLDDLLVRIIEGYLSR